MITLQKLIEQTLNFEGKTFTIQYMGLDSGGRPFFFWVSTLGATTYTFQTIPPITTTRICIQDVSATNFFCVQLIDVYSADANQMTFDFVGNCIPTGQGTITDTRPCCDLSAIKDASGICTVYGIPPTPIICKSGEINMLGYCVPTLYVYAGLGILALVLLMRK